ncbi:hypothetical protein [Nonomuraea basaltis]|uniref:hypothetical protein n=1 Tax=Nonomuraea basaltis TaxID=2495887 RepID=UPI00110C45D5|nr:hypothetical protein [Nonomuraea basaltis]TMR98829.1 hypothetical protein EJK15_10965 [Nonomuraea basaltis]
MQPDQDVLAGRREPLGGGQEQLGARAERPDWPDLVTLVTTGWRSARLIRASPAGRLAPSARCMLST